MAGIIKYFCYGIHLLTLGINCTNATFSRTNTEVVFNRVFPINQSGVTYHPNELIPMVSLVSTKFTKVTTEAVDTTADRNTVLIPIAVATFNKFLRKAGVSPLELSITFGITNDLNESAGCPPNGWISLVEILDEANHVYPGTVKRLYVEHHGIISVSTDLETEQFENYFANVNFPRNETYELGISLPMDYCNSEGLPQVLKHVRHLSFYKWANEDGNQTPDVEIKKTFRKFSECKQIIEGYGIIVTFRVETGWLCLNQTSGPKQDEKLVRYWSEVNEWAEMSNTSVLLWEAFDFPEATEDTELDYMGLWRRVPNASYKNISEYVFKEKVSTPASSSSFYPRLLLFLQFLSFTSGIIAAILFIRQFHPNLFYKKNRPMLSKFCKILPIVH